ncbi:ATP-dependent Clp protease ATP-binding protein [Candidatus Magnetoovum chiemensis]|nr:ATP-dependent Clp protease ATP-binding protein [Candidatus Magnetoovum chiemensis]
MTGTPISTLKGEQKDKLKSLAETLKKRIIGQDQAIEKLTQSLIHRRMDIGNPERPLGVYLFAGDTGVGKTELARATALSFFGDEKKLIHIDLGEYSDHTSINKLIGTPYGYAGYDEEGVLIRGLQTHPSCIILFDEIEKASPELHRLLLGLLDNGRIANGRGERYDARQCVIIMTTNAVTSREMEQVAMGFSSGETRSINVHEHLSKTFPREFLGRIDEIIPFNRLTKDNMRSIMKMRVSEAIERLRSKGIMLEYEEERLIEHLLGHLEAEQSGARAISRILEKRLLHPLAIELLESGNGKKVVVKLDDDFYEKGEIVNSNR